MNDQPADTAATAGGGNAGQDDFLPETGISRVIDAGLARIGAVASWVWPVLIVLICLHVGLRYLAGLNLVMLEELFWHLYGAGFMLGLSWGVVRNAHVRVDVLAERLGPRTRAGIEAAGLVLLLIPFAGVLAWEAWPFVMRAWELDEVSVAPGGLGFRWAIKSFLLTGAGLLLLAALSRLTRALAGLFAPPPERREPV